MLLIIVILASLSVLSISAISVITQTHKNFSVSSEEYTEDTATKGRFICYKNSNDKYEQIIIKYDTNGNKLPVEKSEVKNGYCELPIPDADKFYITLIGGGGGGATPSFQFMKDEIYESTVVFQNHGYYLSSNFFSEYKKKYNDSLDTLIKNFLNSNCSLNGDIWTCYSPINGGFVKAMVSSPQYYKEAYLHFTLKKTYALIHQAQAGSAGEVSETLSVNELTNASDTIFKIPVSNIGKGGNAGHDGTETKLNINSANQKYSITAQGGKAGARKAEKFILGDYKGVTSDKNIKENQSIVGENGKNPDYVLSSDFGLSDLHAGYSAPDGNAVSASLFGASGAGGSIKYAPHITETGGKWLLPCITAENAAFSSASIKIQQCSTTPSTNQYIKSGSKGANGAIIISW